MAFPSNPTNLQQATVNNVIYVYNSTKAAWNKLATVGNAIVANSLQLTGGTPSTSTSTGDLVVAGGVGIAGDLEVGGTASSFAGSLGIGTSSPTAVLQLAAGTATASTAPLKFTSGTNLTVAEAGAIEYDGKVMYATPQSTQRGLIPGMQYFRLNSNLTGADVNTAQSFFGVGVTLSSSTIYKFEYTIAMAKTTGTTSHNVSLLFGGTATINNISYFTQIKFNTLAFTSVSSTDSWSVFSQIAGARTIFTGLTSATGYHTYFCTGTVSINSGGTFIPQYILSAAPGGAYTVQGGSDFLIYPVGAAGSNTSIGTWA